MSGEEISSLPFPANVGKMSRLSDKLKNIESPVVSINKVLRKKQQNSRSIKRKVICANLIL